MSPMQLYIKFLFTLAVGLAGLAMVLKTLFETILLEWDAVARLKTMWRQAFSHSHHASVLRADDILMEIERDRVKRLPEQSIDRRREELREAREVEVRLSSPRTV